MTMTDDLKSFINDAINSVLSLDEISLHLKELRQKGLTQNDAIELLEAMRNNADEEYEDKLLEILDIVTGYCNNNLKVW